MLAHCARLVLLGCLAAACTDTTDVTAPMNALPSGPSLSTFPIPDAGYLAQTTKIDISGLADLQSFSSITDGTQTVTFDQPLFKLPPYQGWGTPPAVESPNPDVLVTPAANVAPVLALTLSRPTATFGFEGVTAVTPGTVISMTAEFYSPSGSLVETMTRSYSVFGGLLFAAGSVGLISRVLIYLPNPQIGIAQIRYGELLEASATIDGSGSVRPNTGVAVVTGTITCNVPATVPISVSLEQPQKARRVPILVQASGTTSVACSGTSVWSMALAPSSGGFVNGDATATLDAAAGLTDPPVAVTNGVKLFWGHK